LRYVYADGREELAPTTLVDFPAYADRLPEIRRVLERNGFPSDALQATGMLEDIHADIAEGSPPAGDGRPRVFRLKHACAAH